MVGVASTNDVVEILTSSEHNPEKGPALPHSHIVLIPHPSDDPRDPLVCFMLFCIFVACFLLFGIIVSYFIQLYLVYFFLSRANPLYYLECISYSYLSLIGDSR